MRRVAEALDQIPIKKYNRCMKHWAEYVRIQDTNGIGPDALPKMATFSPAYFSDNATAPAVPPFPAGDFELTSFDETVHCRTLCATQEQLEAARNGQGVPTDFSFIYVPSNKEGGRSYLSKQTLDELRCTSSTALIDRQHYHGRESTEKVRVSELLRDIESPAPFGRGGTQSPSNYLNLSGDLAGHRDSELLSILDLNLMKMLHNASSNQLQGTNDPGKKHEHKTTLIDAQSCAKFHLLANPGATSCWHMDVLNCTWIEVLTGYKLWTIWDDDVTEEIWDKFLELAPDWQPEADKTKTFMLAPGDTLIMLPGFTPHLVGTFGEEYTHLIGGQVLPMHGDYLRRWYQAMETIIESTFVTNEEIPRQLPDLLDTLRQIMRGSLDRHDSMFTAQQLKDLDEFIIKIRPRLSCDCEGGNCSSKTCHCHGYENENKEVRAHSVGCTKWCHGGDYLDELRQCVHMKKKPQKAVKTGGAPKGKSEVGLATGETSGNASKRRRRTAKVEDAEVNIDE